MRLPAAVLICFAALALGACASSTSKPWYPGTEHPTVPHVVANEEYGDWQPAPGYAWDDPSGYSENTRVHWAPGTRHPRAKGLMAGFEAHTWRPAPGWVFANPADKLDFSARWQPGIPHPSFPHVVAGGAEDRWEPQAGYEWVDGDNPSMQVQTIR